MMGQHPGLNKFIILIIVLFVLFQLLLIGSIIEVTLRYAL